MFRLPIITCLGACLALACGAAVGSEVDDATDCDAGGCEDIVREDAPESAAAPDVTADAAPAESPSTTVVREPAPTDLRQCRFTPTGCRYPEDAPRKPGLPPVVDPSPALDVTSDDSLEADGRAR